MNDIEALRCLVAEQLPPGGIEQLAAAAAFDRIEADLAAMTARAEAAEAWRADVPWSTLTNIVDAAFHLAKNTHDAELWAECAAVEDWVDAYGIGTNAEHAALEAEFAESRRIAEGVQRAYARYAADRAHFGLPPVTFDQWFRWAIGEVQR